MVFKFKANKGTQRVEKNRETGQELLAFLQTALARFWIPELCPCSRRSCTVKNPPPAQGLRHIRHQGKDKFIPPRGIWIHNYCSEDVGGTERHRGSSLEDEQTVVKGTKASITPETGASEKRWFNEKVLSRAHCGEQPVSSCFLSVPGQVALPLGQEPLPSSVGLGPQCLRINPCRARQKGAELRCHPRLCICRVL
jgi:hypothetical protein